MNEFPLPPFGRAIRGALVVCAFIAGQAFAAEPLRADAEKALRRAVEFLRNEVAVEGTYLWQYSADLSAREGEGRATDQQGWVQPPGTPFVGMALLKAWEATNDPYYLEAAQETASGLLRGQMQSGGWHYAIQFDPKERRKQAYRDGGKKGGRNVTTFDDDTTQAALRFLMRMDKALKFEDEKIHDAVIYALNAIFKAQYPNGAWPQGYDQFPNPEEYPVKKASYPEEWSRTWPGSKQYWLKYTLNDNALATMIETLFEAAHIYSEAGAESRELADKARGSAEKAGGFLILAQMPEPQPAWAQQYDYEMCPSWARKFEPPSITGGESQGVLRMLMDLYRETGDRKYLEPIPRALAYLKRSRLSDGRLARFYELKTNKPLYFTKDYQLTYDDSDMPTHYSFKVDDRTDQIAKEYERVKSLSPAQLAKERTDSPVRITDSLRNQVKAIIASQDARGAWVEEGQLKSAPDKQGVIRSRTFAQNIETLSNYLAAK